MLLLFYHKNFKKVPIYFRTVSSDSSSISFTLLFSGPSLAFPYVFFPFQGTVTRKLLTEEILQSHSEQPYPKPWLMELTKMKTAPNVTDE